MQLIRSTAEIKITVQLSGNEASALAFLSEFGPEKLADCFAASISKQFGVGGKHRDGMVFLLRAVRDKVAPALNAIEASLSDKRGANSEGPPIHHARGDEA